MAKAVQESNGKRKRSEAQGDDTPELKRVKGKDTLPSDESGGRFKLNDVKYSVQDGKTVVQHAGQTYTEEQLETLKAQKQEYRRQRREAKQVQLKGDNKSTPSPKRTPQVATGRAERKKAKKERRRLEREALAAQVDVDKSSESGGQKKGRIPKAESNQVDASKRKEKLLARLSRLEGSQLAGQNISKDLGRSLAKADKIITKSQLTSQDALSKVRNRLSHLESDDWEVSDVSSGRFLVHDPVFSLDERHFFLAKYEEVQVYDTRTSLLARSLPAKGVKCFALSVSNARHIFIGTRTGQIFLYDWTIGEVRQAISIPKTSAIYALNTAQLPGTEEDILITLETRRENVSLAEDVIAVHKGPWDESADACQVLYRSDRPLCQLKVLDDGNAIFAASETKMIIGTVDKSRATSDTPSASLSLLPPTYRWMELQPSSSIVCLDAQSRVNAEHQGKKKQQMNYDLALGTSNGEILVYEDVVKQLISLYLEGQSKSLQHRAFKWHREAPAAVKWSKDGNYVISGGGETVLCLWQLETGNRTDLPHLTAGVKGLTVSPRGISYAVLLSDNSAIVLSTTELKPKAAVGGIQSSYVNYVARSGHSSSGDSRASMSNHATRLYNATPLVNNPRSSKEILLAVPIDQRVHESADKAPSASFLQTFDVQAGQHSSRQALTRNLVTEIKIDPEWNKLEVPNVTHIAISHDGKWLATVDEWLPPARSLNHLSYDEQEVDVERRKRRETYLKIWLWNDENSIWTLNTRFDSPHRAEDDECASRIFDLVAHPTKSGFSTIGEDSIVRTWRPRSRADQFFWESSALVSIDRDTAGLTDVSDFPMYSSPVIGRLAYSNDGSVLAATQQDDGIVQHSTINMIDTRTSEVRSAETSLAAGKVLALAFLQRYLIVISDKLCVWDAVKNSLVYSTEFLKVVKTLPLPFRMATTHLAVNLNTETFAVAGSAISNEQKTSVQVFSPFNATPLFETHLRHAMVSALTTLTHTSGFLVLDSQARLRTIAPTKSPIIHGSKAQPMRLAIEKADSDDATAVASRGTVEELNGDKMIVQGDKLAKIFETGSGGFGLPPVKELFDSIAGLFANK